MVVVVFAYLQKMTMVDFPGKIAATVFTIGCNFRCPFCHNPELVIPPLAPPLYSEDEVISFLEKRKGKLSGLCITGGEPTLHGDDLLSFMKRVKDLGYAVKLDTNGSAPDVLQSYLDAGVLDYVAMDIKTSPEKYSMAIGYPEGLEDIVKRLSLSLDILKNSGISYELRTTAVPIFVDKKDFPLIGKWIEGAPLYVIQRYRKEKVLDYEKSPDATYSKDDLMEFAEIVKSYVGRVEVRW